MRARPFALGILISLSLLFNATVSRGEETTNAGILGNLVWFQIGGSLPILLETNDQATDGCWTSVVATQNAVKLEFQRSNLDLYEDEETGSTYLLLNVVGYQTNEYSCVAYVSLIASSFAIETTVLSDMTLRTGDYPIFWQSGSLLSGSKSNMPNRIKNVAVELTQSLILRISEEQKQFREKLKQNKTLSEDQKNLWNTYIKLFLEGKAN